MATFTTADGLTFNLPDEGTVFRATGDTTKSSYYTIKDGALSTTGPTAIAATDLRSPDGTIIKAGQPIPGGAAKIENGWSTVNPGYTGNWVSLNNGASQYDAINGAGAYSTLPEFNLADIQTALQKLGGKLPTGNVSQVVDPTNPNATNTLNAQGQVISQPNAPGQPGAITPTPSYTNPNANFQNTGSTAGFTNNVQQGAQPQTSSGYMGPSIVDYLSSIGQPSDYASRAALAAANGIQNYTGTAAQNTQLLQMLRSQGGATGKNASGITTGGTMGGSTQNTGSTNNIGSTGASDPYAGLDPIQKQVKMYTDAASALGLPTIKQQYQSMLDKQKELTDEMNKKISDVNNNPWYSEGIRVKEIQKIQDKYKTDLETYSNLATLYDSLYKQGQAQVEKIVSGAEADVKAANDLAQKQLDAATALAKDNQVVSIGGNEVLVNKSTGKTIAVLGPSSTPKTPTSTAKGSQTSAQFVANTLKTQGLDYQTVIQSIPAGRVGVIDNKTGTIGSILPSEYDSSKYTYL